MSAVAARSPAIVRGFVSIDEGQVHLRSAGPTLGSAGAPLVLVHASPGSSRVLEPLILALARAAPQRTILALDTLGNGDSALPAVERPDLRYFAGAHMRALDALGVGDLDLYGSHTGAGIAAEIAIARPTRVRRLVLDGMSIYAPDEREEMIARYAPGIAPDLNGSHLNWVWHFVRDTYLFWPWFKRDREHSRRNGLPAPEVLHVKVVEVLKALTTYHLSYQASMAYDKEGRLPLLSVPTLVVCARDDMLFEYFDRIVALVPGAQAREIDGIGTPVAAGHTAGALLEFFDHGAAA